MVIFMRVLQEERMLSPEDEAFFDQFYRDHKRLLYYLASKYVSADVCDDLVQDVLERLMKQSHTIQKIANESGKLAYYINATVQSTIVDRFRAEGGAASVTVPPDTLDNLDQERISARQLPFEDTYWDIQLLKKKLPAKDWMLLEGKYLIGYSDEELGRLYGCSKNSVRMILTRVKRKAKELLFADGTEGGMSNGR